MSLRRTKVAVVIHLNSFVRVTPLVGGYLKAFALQSPEIAANWQIDLLSYFVQTPASTILRDVLQRRPEVIAFSVYTWNAKLVTRLLMPLRELLPNAQFLLGGVEVVGRAAEVLCAAHENVAVCNGEGEKTFQEYLLQLGCEQPDLTTVGGLSVYRDRTLITTPNQERIRDLSQIPSPWLNDYFTPAEMSEIVLFETNRGCPFACDFCFWGGAVGQKVNKIELDRVREEITYIGRHQAKTLSLCDANFGLTKNDVAIAEHIVATKARWGFPTRVVFSTAKNNKHSILEISRLLHEHGMMSEQAISLQSMNETALDTARRSNIKLDVYTDLQRHLNRLEVASHIELIWPLPGETLASFKQGIQQLCEIGSQGFWIYPLLWLHNVGFEKRTDELGVVTIDEPDPNSAARMVIATKEVSVDEYAYGVEYAAAVMLLFNCRGLYLTTYLLNHYGVCPFRDVFDAFVEWMHQERDNPISTTWRNSVRQFEEMSKYTFRGFLVHAVLHEHRPLFDGLLQQFYAERLRPLMTSSEHRTAVDAAFEFDILSRPYLYVQTPLSVAVDLSESRIHEQRRGKWIVDVGYDFPALIRTIRQGGSLQEHLEPSPRRILIDHSPGMTFRLFSKQEQEHHEHCFQAVRGMGNFEARYTYLTVEITTAEPSMSAVAVTEP